MQIEITDKERKLHIRAIEDNLGWWMYDCGCCEDYYREICSGIIMLEKLVDEDYKFRGYSWNGSNAVTVADLKEDYIATLKEYAEEEEDSFVKGQASEALAFVSEFFLTT